MSCCSIPSPRDACPDCPHGGRLCENCGLCSVCDVSEETPIRIAPVTPIAPMSQCSGCGTTVRHEDRFKLEVHAEGCPQPEIRMKRLEREVAQLKEIVFQLVSANNDSVTNQCDLNTRLLALENHGTSEAIPDTEPSGFAERVRAGNELDTDGWVKRAEAADPVEPPADASAAGSAGSAYVGPDAARGEPECPI